MNKLYNILSKKKSYDNPPIWIMRQAGRYLPEYRNLRKDVSDFLELCYNPKLASEVTLQPIKRFDFDAAIIFSDILVIPDALGVDVKFVKGEGPKLRKYKLSDLNIDNIENHLQPVFENLQLTRLNLDKGKDLIGFSGCPWTLACYMIEGGSSKNFDKIRRFAYENEQELHELFDILIEAIANYCILQIEAGANIIKLFDSWAGILPANQIDKWVIDPIKRIIAKIKNKHSEVPIIVFPKGLGVNYKKAALALNCEALAIDQTLNINWAKENLQNKEIDKVIQGNFDNFLLAFGSKKEIEEKALEILNNFKGKRFIFNLGHGILQETPIENVEFLVNLVKSYKG